MYDFAIWDVMNRRTYPHVSADLHIRSLIRAQDRHVYMVVPTLTNEGALTANDWTLHVDLPSGLARCDLDTHNVLTAVGEIREGARRMSRYEYSSERQPPHCRSRLLPGETHCLDEGRGFGQLLLRIEGEIGYALLDNQPPLCWTLFVDNAPKREGMIEYARWCNW